MKDTTTCLITSHRQTISFTTSKLGHLRNQPLNLSFYTEHDTTQHLTSCPLPAYSVHRQGREKASLDALLSNRQNSGALPTVLATNCYGYDRSKPQPSQTRYKYPLAVLYANKEDPTCQGQMSIKNAPTTDPCRDLYFNKHEILHFCGVIRYSKKRMSKYRMTGYCKNISFYINVGIMRSITKLNVTLKTVPNGMPFLCRIKLNLEIHCHKMPKKLKVQACSRKDQKDQMKSANLVDIEHNSLKAAHHLFKSLTVERQQESKSITVCLFVVGWGFFLVGWSDYRT